MATDDKYDRQLRLWGPHGQKALMSSHLCVLGTSAVATETLKNLVLPGIGRFTVVDSARAEPADLGTNFFVEESDLGKPRAEAACRWLQELNPDVQGAFIERDPAQVIAEGVPFFKPYSMVIACQLTEGLARQLSKCCQELNIALLLLTSVGFVGKLRVYVAEHAVCETKPDSELGDLRLTDPFPELRRFADSINFETLDEAQHAHVPYVVILIQALDRFRKASGKALPSTREDKDELKKIILKMRRKDVEVNFAEALDNAYKAWVPYSIPDSVQNVLSMAGEGKKSDFWIVARAVSQFVRDCGKLPLAGSLPDMTASTDLYVKLQEIYGSRAGGDCAAINAHIAALQKEVGAEPSILPDYVQRFCRNAQCCEVFSYRSLDEEFRPSSPEEGGLDLAEEVQDEDSLVQWYLAMRAADQFREERGHWPGALCGDGEAALSADVAELTQVAARILETYKAQGVSLDPKMVEEIVRYGGAEIHTTSSVLGGIASQEAVKLLTKQYSPLNNTLIYDGLHGKTQTLTL